MEGRIPRKHRSINIERCLSNPSVHDDTAMELVSEDPPRTPSVSGGNGSPMRN